MSHKVLTRTCLVTLALCPVAPQALQKSPDPEQRQKSMLEVTLDLFRDEGLSAFWKVGVAVVGAWPWCVLWGGWVEGWVRVRERL